MKSTMMFAVLVASAATAVCGFAAQSENVKFAVGGEWRLADMPSRDVVAGSAIDLSGQIDFAPCGTYGKIVQDGERLYFEKRPDRPIRFLGNHSGAQWVCDPEPDEKSYCDQMQRVGCNAIRLAVHRLTGEWWFSPEENRKRFKSSDGFFIDDRIDNFCRYVAEFNRRGIYLLLGSAAHIESSAMMVGDRDALDGYRRFMVRFLNYRNPYTGNLIKDEPCVVGWEFPNEQSVQHVHRVCVQAPNPDALSSAQSSRDQIKEHWACKTREAIAPKWEAFLQRKYGADWEAHKAYPKRFTGKTQNALDFHLFSQELMEAQIAFYYELAREVGWNKLLMWGNYDKILRTTETRVKTGMPTEVNSYHAFWYDTGRSPQISLAGDGMSSFRNIAGAAIPGKTVFVTEFNDDQHNRYCHEMGLAAGAVAALQGWNAFYFHNSTVMTDKIDLNRGLRSIFNQSLVIANHASMRASVFLAACLYGRGDAATSPHTVKLDYTKDFMNALSSTSYPDPQQLRSVMLCRTRVDWPEYGMTPDYKADLVFPGFGNDAMGTYAFLHAQAVDSKSHTAVLETMVAKMREKGVLAPGNRTDVKAGVYESDTGELLVESAVPRMRVVTARTEALTLPADGACRADCLEVVSTKNNATFGAVAMDGKALVKSGRIVVVMNGESAIDGTVKTPDLQHYVDFDTDEGRKRMQGRKIYRANVANVRLRNVTGGDFTLYPLSVNGIRRDPVKVVREGDDLVFTLDTRETALPKGITPFFELVRVAERPCVFAEESRTAPFREGEKVLFLGDSITHGGWYVAQLQYIWQLRNPGRRATFVNCGISGNTAKSGLDRFDWDVAPERPDRIFIMFGMNDVGRGGYWDPATADAGAFAARRQRVANFRTNMKALVEKCRAIGARVTLVTSTPYDQYSQLIDNAIAPGVNDPGICSLAMATRQLAAEEKVDFVDLYDQLTPILRDNPEVKFLADRVHPHEDGHLLMAALILKASGFSPVVGKAEFDAADGSRKFRYSPVALPLPAGKFYTNVDRVYPLTATLNSEVVRIRNLPNGTYRLLAAGVEIGVHSAAELAGGVNIATCDTPSQRKAKEGLKLVKEIKELAGGLRGLPQGYVQIMKRGGDVNDQASAFAKLDEWMEELRVSNPAGSIYYGGEVKRFKALYPKRDAEKARLEKLRDELFEFCRPEPFELSVEPIAS